MALRPRVLLAALLLLLVWRGAASAYALLAELGGGGGEHLFAALTASEEERIRLTLAQQDEAQDLPRGYHDELLRAILAHVEPGGQIVTLRRRGMPRERNLAALNALVFPRTFVRVQGTAAADWVPPPGTIVLDFDDELRAELAPRMQVLAQGANWALWR